MPNDHTGKRRVLITGGSGRVGSAIRRELADRYVFRVLDLVEPADQSEGDQFILGDAGDLATMLSVTEGVDVIIHLAIIAMRWDHVTEAQRAGTTFLMDMPSVWNALEGARINGVKVVVYSSSNHVTGLNERDGLISHPDLPPRPDGVYGAGKVFGEALGRFYADQMGIRVYCLRIGNFRDEPERVYRPGQSRWLSPRDLGQMVWRCVEAEHVPFGVFYGVSGGAEKKWDISNARELIGYEPQDDGSAEYWQRKYGGKV